MEQMIQAAADVALALAVIFAISGASALISNAVYRAIFRPQGNNMSENQTNPTESSTTTTVADYANTLLSKVSFEDFAAFWFSKQAGWEFNPDDDTQVRRKLTLPDNSEVSALYAIVDWAEENAYIETASAVNLVLEPLSNRTLDQVDTLLEAIVASPFIGGWALTVAVDAPVGTETDGA